MLFDTGEPFWISAKIAAVKFTAHVDVNEEADEFEQQPAH